MKKILMIGTGGTIASEMTEAGLAPGMAGADFLRYVPAVRRLCQVDPIQVCNIDSTDMTPNHWLAIARAVEEHYDDYDGFVICHGTDTMAYTAAALSYLIQGSPKPIVLTGSQKPIHMEITDSKTNLLDSFTVACDGRLPGVTVVFGGRIIPGTRARKTYSKSFGAFSSINHPILGVVQEGKVTPYILPERAPRPAFFHRLDQAVSLVKLVPGQSPDYLAFALEHSHGVLVESFGVGGVPAGRAGGFYPLIQQAAARGKTVVFTTQVQNEGSDLGVYQVGHGLKTDLGVLEAHDMTLEAAYAKLMWALAHSQDREELARRFYTPVARDILLGPDMA